MKSDGYEILLFRNAISIDVFDTFLYTFYFYNGFIVNQALSAFKARVFMFPYIRTKWPLALVKGYETNNSSYISLGFPIL